MFRKPWVQPGSLFHTSQPPGDRKRNNERVHPPLCASVAKFALPHGLVETQDLEMAREQVKLRHFVLGC
jgi:hypothetical protein